MRHRLHDAQAQEAAQLAGRHFAFDLARERKHLFRLPLNRLSGFGKARPRAGPVEQAAAEISLHLANAPRNRRLRDIQLPRGGMKGAEPRDPVEGFDLGKR